MKSRRPDSTVIDSLYRISSLLGKTEDAREALGLILNEIMQVLSATSGSISLINPDSGQLEIETTRGLPSHSPEIKLKPGQGITGWVALHGKPLLVRDVRKELRYFELKGSVRSEMAVPMEEQGQVIGVVNVDSDSVGAFDENDLKVLALMTAEAGKVARNLWLIQQLKTKTSQLESMVTIGQRLVSKIELQEILNNITSEAKKIMDCKLCSLFLLTPDKTRLCLHSVSECGETFRKLLPLPVNDSSIGAVIQRKKQVEVLNISKTEENYAFLEVVQAEGLVSFLAAPLFHEGSVIGVINAYTGHKHRFNNDEKRLFQTIASLGAIAIQNARLYSRVFESEEKLRQNDRLNTLGLLSAEIAHEIRNPLTVLKLLFQSLNIEFPEGDPRRRDAAIIDEKLDQLETIVNRVLTFARSSETPHHKWNLTEVIKNTLLLIRLKLEQSKIRMQCSSPSSPVFVEGHKGQLEQVFLNVILNAVQAMREGGDLSIDIITEEKLGQSPSAVVRIADNGCGIPPELEAKVFDFFLSGNEKGSGLGLAIVRRIVESHRGQVEIERSGSTGTTMKVTLPLAKA